MPGLTGRGRTHGRNGNSIGDLLHDGTGGTQSWRSDVVADKVVNDDGSHDVQANFKDLQHAKRLGKVLGLLHLGNETKEGDVGAVGEDDVGDGGERVVEVGLGGDVDVAALELDTDGDHGDQDGGEDTDKGGNGDVGHVLDGPGQGEYHADDHAHDTENDGAGSVVGDGVHHGREGDDMAPHDEDGEE